LILEASLLIDLLTDWEDADNYRQNKPLTCGGTCSTGEELITIEQQWLTLRLPKVWNLKPSMNGGLYSCKELP
jgi:hypothetical protein